MGISLPTLAAPSLIAQHDRNTCGKCGNPVSEAVTTEEGGEHMHYAMGKCISSDRRIYGCSSDGYAVVRVWGIDKRGQQINAVITCTTERIARHAAAAALFELGARAQFCIALNKAQRSRFLGEVEETSPPIHQAAAQHACSSTRR